MTEISDYNAFYGYVTKKEKAVPLHIARKIEKKLCEESIKSRVALGEIERAHRELDALGIPRKQGYSPFSLSLAGRIKTIPSLYVEIHASIEECQEDCLL